MSFSLSTLICSVVTVFWTLFFCSFFSVFSGVGKRFASDDDDDDDDDDEDDNDDNNDDDEDSDDDKDDDNDDGDEEDDDDDDDDDDDWLFCCNYNISLYLANWFSNELIISSLVLIVSVKSTRLLVCEP